LTSKQKIQPHHPESPIYQNRFRLFHAIVALSFLLLMTRFWYLQIFRGTQYREFSTRNSVRTLIHYAPRGLILDRNGVILAENRPKFYAVVLPKREILEEALPKVSPILNIPEAEIWKKIQSERNRFLPITIKEDLSWKELAQLESRKSDLAGIWVEWKPTRSYPYGKIAPHLLGYASEISDKELLESRKEDPSRYRLGDLIGKSGIELVYEKILKGIDGGKQILVDAVGRPVLANPSERFSPNEPLLELQEIPARPGEPVLLTIDFRIQKRAEELLQGKAGTIVAMEVQTGEILAMANEPSFDPEMFARGMSPGEWAKLSADRGHPLRNKAIHGLYPPGSTYKLILAAAGLEEKVISPKKQVLCTGGHAVGNRVFKCWKEGGHGTVDMERAIIESCDVYFYKLGEALGIDRLAEYAKRFGLGRPTGIDLDGEKSGLVATTQWKQERFGAPWFAGDLASVSIGQGYNLVTPLQILQAYALLANNGRPIRPHILKSSFAPLPEGYDLNLSKESIEFLRKALFEVVHDPRGTGGRARIPDFEIAGKTGTAQVVALERQHRVEDHAWFVGFAPASAPQIAVVALVEHGGHGGSAAAPLVGDIIQTYYKNETSH
jgi:penicillin-binding protein 2